MTGTLCSSWAVLYKAGVNANGTLIGSGARVEEFINQAEQLIAAELRNDVITNFSGLSANKKKVLELACSNVAAMYCIQYDMSGYTSRTEAEMMLDVLWNGYINAIKTLKEANVKTFVGVES